MKQKKMPQAGYGWGMLPSQAEAKESWSRSEIGRLADVIFCHNTEVVMFAYDKDDKDVLKVPHVEASAQQWLEETSRKNSFVKVSRPSLTLEISTHMTEKRSTDQRRGGACHLKRQREAQCGANLSERTSASGF